jgi:hypothetical protein
MGQQSSVAFEKRQKNHKACMERPSQRYDGVCYGGLGFQSVQTAEVAGRLAGWLRQRKTVVVCA